MRIIPLNHALQDKDADDFSKRMAKLANDSRAVPQSIVIIPGTTGELGGEEETMLEEAYETLGVDASGADQFLSKKVSPAVRLLAEGAPIIIRGPFQGFPAVQENILGLLPLLKEGVCVIIQRAHPAGATAVVTTGAMVHVRTYLGEYDEESPGDEFLVNRDSLAMEGIGVHEQRVRLDIKEGALVESNAGKKGLEQSITDHQARECARIAKRAAMLLGRDLTCVLGIADDIRFLYVIDALAVQPIADLIEKPAEQKTIISTLSGPGKLDTRAVAFLEDCLKIITGVLQTAYGTTGDLADILETHPEYSYAKDVRKVMKQAGLIKDGMSLDASVLAEAYRVTQAVLQA